MNHTVAPSSVSSISLPPEIEFVVLLGTDTETQLLGRIDSIMLFFFNRNNGIDVPISDPMPDDCFVTPPGYGAHGRQDCPVLGA